MNTANLKRSATVIIQGTAVLLLIPLVAMQFTTEVQWSPGDFAAAGALLFFAGISYVAAAQFVRTRSGRLLALVAVLAVLGLVWAELAVGLFH